MSHPDSWPWQRDLEDVLRRELRRVAASVRPGADGLDRIRSQIREQRPAPFGWTMAESAGSAVRGRLSKRNLLPLHRAVQAFLYIGVHRFGPSDQRTWHRWLRPMAALATGIFVIVAGSWAVTALPQIIASSGSSPPIGGGAGRVPLGSDSDSTAPQGGSQHPGSGPGHSNPAAFPQRRHSNSVRSGSAAPPTSNLPSASPSPPASSPPTSSPTSNSPSASPTSPKSCSPSPSPSPTASGPHAHKPHCHKPPHRPSRSPSNRSAQATIGTDDFQPCLPDVLSISACLSIS
jgi:hypothetical protein